MPDYPIAPSVLIWAREQVHLTVEEAAAALKIDREQLSAWERGDAVPTLSQIAKLARLYRRPQVVLLFPEPPPKDRLPNDFRLRTVDGKPLVMSRELLIAVRTAREWQAEVGELAEEDPALVRNVNIPRASITDNPEELAAQLRAQLDVSVEAQLSWGNKAFKHWRERLEVQGILVFVMKIKREVCRGFSLWDEQRVPVILVTSDEMWQAQNFTLFHEYAHLMLRQEAVCVEQVDESERGRTERFCNRFAASVLMPPALLERVFGQPLATIGHRSWSIDELGRYARRLGVSRHALALRLEELRLAERGLYDSVVNELPGDDARPPRKGGGGRWPDIRVSERGTEFTRIVVTALDRRLVNHTEAALLLNLQRKYLRELGAFVEMQRRQYAT